ncbi:MAG: DUF975 family protein [Clostridiaceae bacterium]|jgi:hypothetical protein|nr:DUF975 family protein [Clostridiaceae bacterium]
MWTRAELKARAKAVLRGNYWKAFLISLVIGLSTGGSSGGGSSWRTGGLSELDRYGISSSDMSALIVLIISAAVFAFLVGIAINVLLLNPLQVGGRRYFIQSAQYFDNRGCFRFAFDGYNWKGIVGSMFLKNLYIFLWTLLLIIPGIIKGYAYSMVPYILADNPNIGAKRAIELSDNMTRGHKLDMFVLQLSFIGWYLLGALFFFIGGLFVRPYEDATFAELYLTLRQNAIESGMCSLSELNLYYPGQEEYNF